jgi:hypothetical protein
MLLSGFQDYDCEMNMESYHVSDKRHVGSHGYNKEFKHMCFLLTT